MTVRHHSQTSESLAKDLRALGVVSGDAVLVHSSLSGLGHVQGGAQAVIDALLEAVGSTGTALFPTLTGTAGDGPDAPPSIDVRESPCWTGRIPETARDQPSAIRSLHPTHSVTAIGANAGLWTAGHEHGSSPCDRHSPYHRLIRDGGRILLLGGVTQQSNTTLHCLEEIAAVPYHLQQEITAGVVVGPDGTRHVVRNRLHAWGTPRAFTRVDAPLSQPGGMVSAPVGASIAHLIDGRLLAETILPLLRERPDYLLACVATSPDPPDPTHRPTKASTAP